MPDDGQRLARIDVPDLGRVIIGRGRNPSAVRAERDVGDSFLVARQDLMVLFVATSQMRAVLSLEAVTRLLPSGLNLIFA
jgi:hypothetical protein